VRAPEEMYPLDMGVIENRLASAYPIFDSLNQLGSTPWKINAPVLDLVLVQRFATYI
jgi:DNA-directed RNA polymerase